VRKSNRPVAKQLLFLLIFILLSHPSQSFEQRSHWTDNMYNAARLIDGFYYIALQDAAEILQAHSYYSNKVRKAILYLPNDKITVTAFNPFVLVGQKVIQMPVEAIYKDSDIYLPVKYFLPILQTALRKKNPGSILTETDMSDNIIAVSVEEKANGTLIRVNTRKEFPAANVNMRYSRKWLYLDILGGRVNEKTLTTKIENGLVKKFVPVQSEQMAQLSFQLKKDISERKINLTQHSNEIWISIPSHVNSESTILEKLKNDQEKWKIDKIVIDPGHGGKDPGAIGPRGTYEKNAVLDIAKRLKKIIQKNMKDVEVIMTRNSDKYLSLKERTQLANKQQAKLFISLHANWNRNAKVNGTTTYFLGLAKSEESLEIAQRENAVIKYDSNAPNVNLSEENMILATLAQNAYNKESQDFAAMIQKSLHEKIGLKNRGIKQAGFYVLVGASMPNVLIETAFISNKREAKLLRTKSFQQKMAEGIFESIKNFKHRYEWTMSMN